MTFNTFNDKSNSGHLTSTFYAEQSKGDGKPALSLSRYEASAGSDLEKWLKRRRYVRLEPLYDRVDDPDNRPQREW